MSERRPTWRIVPSEPQPINKPLPKEHQSTLLSWTLEVDGSPAVVAWLNHPKDFFGAYWMRLSTSPNVYFSRAQDLIDRLRHSPEVRPNQRTSIKLEYMVEDDQAPREREIDSFSPVEELDSETLMGANLYTPFGDFGVEKNNGELLGAFTTHLDQYEALGQLIIDNSKDNPPIEEVQELLATMQKMRVASPQS